MYGETFLGQTEYSMFELQSWSYALIFLTPFPSVPPPSVSITHDGGATPYAGSVLTLTCEVTLRDVPAAVQPGLTVVVTLIGTGGSPLSNTARFTVNDQQGSGTTYTRTVVFNTLATGNAGTYDCEADLSHSSQFITSRDDIRGQVPIINIVGE